MLPYMLPSGRSQRATFEATTHTHTHSRPHAQSNPSAPHQERRYHIEEYAVQGGKEHQEIEPVIKLCPVEEDQAESEHRVDADKADHEELIMLKGVHRLAAQAVFLVLGFDNRP